MIPRRRARSRSASLPPPSFHVRKRDFHSFYFKLLRCAGDAKYWKLRVALSITTSLLSKKRWIMHKAVAAFPLIAELNAATSLPQLLRTARGWVMKIWGTRVPTATYLQRRNFGKWYKFETGNIKISAHRKFREIEVARARSNTSRGMDDSEPGLAIIRINFQSNKNFE